MDNFMEKHKIVNVGNSSFIAANEDIFNTDPASDVINMAEWERATFVIQKGAGAAGKAVITVESCDNVTPDTATAIAFKYRKCISGDTFGAWTDATSIGFTTDAGADQVYEISVGSDGLSGEDQYVRLQLTEDTDGPCDGGILAILTDPRYAQSINSTVLV